MNLKGKQLSLLSKILALVFVLACFVVMVLTKIDIPMNDVIKVALFIALVFSPVDISLWIETFFGARRQRTIPDDGKEPAGISNEKS